eukprot:6295343-Ditylum_brightwellii.AAC.1
MFLLDNYLQETLTQTSLFQKLFTNANNVQTSVLSSGSISLSNLEFQRSALSALLGKKNLPVEITHGVIG